MREALSGVSRLLFCGYMWIFCNVSLRVYLFTSPSYGYMPQLNCHLSCPMPYYLMMIHVIHSKHFAWSFTQTYISFLVIRLNHSELLDNSLYLYFCDTHQIFAFASFFASQVSALFPFSQCYKTLAFLNLLVARLYAQCVRLLSSGICTRFSGSSLSRDFMKTTMSKVRAREHAQNI